MSQANQSKHVRFSRIPFAFLLNLESFTERRDCKGANNHNCTLIIKMMCFTLHAKNYLK